VLLLLSGVILLTMIAVSAYGAVTLSPDARVWGHWPPSPFRKGASKAPGSRYSPSGGAVFEGFLLAVYADSRLRDRPGGLVALLVSVYILLAFQAGAVAAARRKTRNPSHRYRWRRHFAA
jgi:hypothetical protein